jgi:hypothetical protein
LRCKRITDEAFARRGDLPAQRRRRAKHWRDAILRTRLGIRDPRLDQQRRARVHIRNEAQQVQQVFRLEHLAADIDTSMFVGLAGLIKFIGSLWYGWGLNCIGTPQVGEDEQS